GVFVVLGALAFLPEAPLVDGVFESMSAITTTGLSVMDASTLPRSLHFFRAFGQWLGGVGIVVLTLQSIVGAGRAAARLYAAESGAENTLGSVAATARAATKTYVALTALCGLGFALAGVPVFDALLHAFATVSTGGFSTRPESLGAYGDGARMVAILFMLAGATSLPLIGLALRRDPKPLWRDGQARLLLGLLTAGTLALVAVRGWRIDATLESLFDATSALTTTGFSGAAAFPSADEESLIGVVLMAFGGAAGSTAGGVKLYRLLLWARVALWVITRRLLPEEAKVPLMLGGTAVSDREVRELTAFLGGYLSLALFTALALSLSGHAIGASLFESVSALSTVGLSAGVVSPTLAWWAKLLLAFDMWVGRVEILPVIILLYPGTWTRGGSA
ncbi:MAG: hypothetical protein K8I02_01530, partial [Candidatus Methylomirabilis sp.]|nr:hypothetical protein [Deltaproteobacteria bacterium]